MQAETAREYMTSSCHESNCMEMVRIVKVMVMELATGKQLYTYNMEGSNRKPRGKYTQGENPK